MNNIAAGAIGGVAVLTVAASAMLFANYRGSADEADGAAPQEVATKTVCSEERVVTKKQWGTNGVLCWRCAGPSDRRRQRQGRGHRRRCGRRRVCGQAHRQ